MALINSQLQRQPADCVCVCLAVCQGGRRWCVGVKLESNKAKSHKVLGQSKPAQLGTSCPLLRVCVWASLESQWDTGLKEREKERMHHQWSPVKIATEGMQWLERDVSELHHNAFAPVCTRASICTDVYDLREPEFLPNLWPLQDCSLCAAHIYFFLLQFTVKNSHPHSYVQELTYALMIHHRKELFFASYVVFLPFNTLNITFDVSKQRLAVFKTTYTTVCTDLAKMYRAHFGFSLRSWRVQL